MTANPITGRTYYEIEIELASPLCVSGGDDFYSDSDVCVNGNGECFVPGTSLAGALRYYTGNSKEEKSIFGHIPIKNGQGDDQNVESDPYADGRMSAVSVSDLYFHRDIRLSVRDRVSLSQDKTVDNKFDCQIIETGGTGSFRIIITRRENDSFEEMETAIDKAILAIESGEIRFGSLKNRGFGRMRVMNVARKHFQKEHLEDYIKWLQDGAGMEVEKKPYTEWAEGFAKKPSHYVTFSVPLKLTGGISIRRYSAKPEAADFEHITCNEKPVIPGTSWNGALRADALRLLQMLNPQKAENLIKLWFGQVTGKDKEVKAEQSLVVVGESILSNSKRLHLTRNKINRFTGATVGEALYQEISFFGGETELTLMVRKDEHRQYKALIGLLYLVLYDLKNGFIAVGGQGAVGRGVFEADETREEIIGDPDKIVCGDCLKELYKVVNQ